MSRMIIHRFRLYPSKAVQQRLFDSLDQSCFLYNYCLSRNIHDVRILVVEHQRNVKNASKQLARQQHRLSRKKVINVESGNIE